MKLKNTTKWMALLACTAGLAMTTAGCQHEATPANKAEMMMKAPGDIIDVATGPGMGNVTTLVKAIQAAGLVDTLKGDGPFTVFAPTNAAFDALPAGELNELLRPENKEKLKAILLYHVHPGDAYVASELMTMQLASADDKKPIKITVRDGTVMVNDAKVTKADVICKNGVIHQIDKVLMPPTDTGMPGM